MSIIEFLAPRVIIIKRFRVGPRPQNVGRVLFTAKVTGFVIALRYLSPPCPLSLRQYNLSAIHYAHIFAITESLSRSLRDRTSDLLGNAWSRYLSATSVEHPAKMRRGKPHHFLFNVTFLARSAVGSCRSSNDFLEITLLQVIPFA